MPATDSVWSSPVRSVPETHAVASALSLASGDEQPVRSPALELQEALEEMFSTRASPAPEPRNVVALSLGLIAVAGICGAFWIGVGRMLIALA